MASAEDLRRWEAIHPEPTWEEALAVLQSACPLLRALSTQIEANRKALEDLGQGSREMSVAIGRASTCP